MFRFNSKYFLLAILLFITEVLIALFVHDKIIRPYIGDFLVVILIYCFIKSFINLSVIKTAIIVLFIAFTMEFLQYLNILKTLGLEKVKLAKIVLGSAFEWMDLVTYTAGIAVVLIIEAYNDRKISSTTDK